MQVLLLNPEGQTNFCHKLQKLKKQVSFYYPSQRNEHIKIWETHPNEYWVFSKMADLLSLISWSSTFQDGGESNFLPWGRSGSDVKFPTQVHFTDSNSRGLPPPPPPPTSWGKALTLNGMKIKLSGAKN